MAIALKCTCGALLEIDDRFLGHMIQCPDCGRSLQASPGEKRPLRTSGWAISSLFLSLAGAFTFVGPLLAIGAGALGLRSIRKNPDQLAGRGYALAGIVLGFAFTIISALALIAPELLHLDAVLRGPDWAGRLDFAGPLQVDTDRGFTIARPSLSWGVYRGQSDTENGNRPAMLHRDFAILVNVQQDAHAIGFVFFKDQLVDEQGEEQKTVLEQFGRSELIRLLGRRAAGADAVPVEVQSTKTLIDDGREVQELTVSTKPGRQERTFVMRVIRSGNDTYIIAAGAKKRRFAGLEKELRQIVQDFRVKR